MARPTLYHPFRSAVIATLGQPSSIKYNLYEENRQNGKAIRRTEFKKLASSPALRLDHRRFLDLTTQELLSHVYRGQFYGLPQVSKIQSATEGVCKSCSMKLAGPFIEPARTCEAASKRERYHIASLPNGSMAGIQPCANSKAKQAFGMAYWMASPRLK